MDYLQGDGTACEVAARARLQAPDQSEKFAVELCRFFEVPDLNVHAEQVRCLGWRVRAGLSGRPFSSVPFTGHVLPLYEFPPGSLENHASQSRARFKR